MVLAQGLSELGHNNFSLKEYWKDYLSEEFLFQKYSGEEVDAIIVSSIKLDVNKEILKMIKFYKVPHILIDSSDGGSVTTGVSFANDFDFVLKCHFNKNLFVEKKFIPWQFSLTNHQIGWLENLSLIPSNTIEINFRNVHQIRSKGMKILEKNIPQNCKFSFSYDNYYSNSTNEAAYSDEERHYISYTKSRCNPRFYERLCRSVLAPVFGGFFFDSSPSQLKQQLNRILVKSNIKVPQSVFLAQFDSWRLWESAFLGLPMIHFDLDRYGAKFPVQPTNGRDYFGVDIYGKVNNIPLCDVLKDAKNVGMAGREWARSYYKPVSIATRFLGLLC